MITVFIGPPGSGKGTQAKMAAEKFSLTHLSSGELLRSQTAAGTAKGNEALEYMRSGKLVPNRIIVEMILDELGSGADFILDGFPRELDQAQALSEALATQGREVNRAVLFNVREREVVERLSQRVHCINCKSQYNSSTLPPKRDGICDSCGGQLIRREDDHPNVIRQRLKVYQQQTAPLAGYYRDLGILTEVDASDTIDNVHMAITTALGGGASVT